MLYAKLKCLVVLAITPFSFALTPRDSPQSWGKGTVTTTTTGNVTRAVLNNPPLNICDATLLNDLTLFFTSLQATDPPPPKVVIFSSAIAESFMYHIDIHLLSNRTPTDNNLGSIIQYANIMSLLNSLPPIFIGEVSGGAFGAGNE